MAVLVLTQRFDATADVVIDELNRRGVPLVRADLGDLTVSAELDGPRWTGVLAAEHHAVKLDDITGIYYRRPTNPTAPDGVSREVAEWIEAEQRWGLRGLLAALTRETWVNWPPAIHAAEHKPYQLAQAADVGLSVPETLITNDPDTAAEFARRAKPVLYKAFRGNPVEIDGEPRLVYATEVTAEQCRAESVRVAPVMLQHRIDKAFDARVTRVDDHVFAVIPRTESGAAPLDWRIDHAANTWHPVEVPADVRAGLLRLLDRLDLRFAACDFSVDHAGRWRFLEANPAGQWAWNHLLRDQITAALANALTQETTP
ncbi:MvdC/MvdD family ATP grasp protein [Saccharopolyspora taberi]|uniref:ATP-grasp ribosomal peptide maturase n=1 Tax=Saccharopolyspora taberi TaxID=60895 RepID=A0ABN3VCF2_9PSEU